MRKWAIAAILLLAGCVGQDMTSAMNPYLGRPASDVFAKLGMPNSEGTIAGKHYYAWGSSQTVSTGPTITTGSGTAAGQPYTYSQFSNQAAGYSTYECSLRVFVDGSDIVRYFDGDGNYGGCESYIDRLKR
jgi:hypothetical protein